MRLFDPQSAKDCLGLGLDRLSRIWDFVES